MIENIILISVIVLILGSAVFCIYRAKKKGAGCIGCPYSSECAKKKNCTCTCSHNEK